MALNEDSWLEAYMESRLSGESFMGTTGDMEGGDLDGNGPEPDEFDTDDSDHEGFDPYAGGYVDDEPIDPFDGWGEGE